MASRPQRSALPRWKARLLAVMVGLVVALSGFVAATSRARSAPASVGFEDKSTGFDELLAERRAVLAKGVESSTSRTWRLALPEKLVRNLFPLKISGHAYDEFSFYRASSNLSIPRVWPEHPNGKWTLHTDSLGLRDDQEPMKERPDLRILVTGDSHTDGVCDNSESYCHQVESELREKFAGRTIEALNAGKGGFSFYNYLGVLERFHALALDPDVFVVGVYGGNDFEEVLTPGHYFAATRREEGASKYWDQVVEAKRHNTECLAQGMLAIKYFRESPDEIDVALGVALGLTGEIVSTCDARHIQVVFIYIPSLYELHPDETMEQLSAVTDALKLERADLERAGAMADRFLAGLRASGATVIDMRPAFLRSHDKLYWEADHHIALAAQALIARELEPVIESILKRRS